MNEPPLDIETAAAPSETPAEHRSRMQGTPTAAGERPPVQKPFWKRIGPGLITGAADDDPSGIGTYSVAGAQFGYGLLWLVPFCIPLMIAVQEMCGRLGAITGKGLAAIIK